jgi:hypothetical protein
MELWRYQTSRMLKMYDGLDNLLAQLHRRPSAEALDDFEGLLSAEIRRRIERRRRTEETLRHNVGIAAVALFVGLSAGVSHMVLAPPTPQHGNAQRPNIGLLLTEIPASSFIE